MISVNLYIVYIHGRCVISCQSCIRTVGRIAWLESVLESWRTQTGPLDHQAVSRLWGESTNAYITVALCSWRRPNEKEKNVALYITSRAFDWALPSPDDPIDSDLRGVHCDWIGRRTFRAWNRNGTDFSHCFFFSMIFKFCFFSQLVVLVGQLGVLYFSYFCRW